MFEQNKRLHQMPQPVPLKEVIWFTKRFPILQILWKLLALVRRGVGRKNKNKRTIPKWAKKTKILFLMTTQN
jgi:hypothetical protein